MLFIIIYIIILYNDKVNAAPLSATFLNTTVYYPNSTVNSPKTVTINGMSSYKLIMVLTACANDTRKIYFRVGDESSEYMYCVVGSNFIRISIQAKISSNQIIINMVEKGGSFTYQHAYFSYVLPIL